MPTRMIRDSVLDSNRYAILSTEAKLLYMHLLLLADDCGCISVSETFLRRRAFHDAPSGPKIASLLNELSDGDLIRMYDADRACFAFIPRFRQRLQRTTLKHPKPPVSIYSDDEHATRLFNQIKDNSVIPTVGQPLSNGESTVTQHTKRREVKEDHPPDGGSTIWDFGISLLTEQGLSARSGRGLIGMWLKDYEERTVADALRSAAGKADVRSYVQAILKTKERKGMQSTSRLAL